MAKQKPKGHLGVMLAIALANSSPQYAVRPLMFGNMSMWHNPQTELNRLQRRDRHGLPKKKKKVTR